MCVAKVFSRVFIPPRPPSFLVSSTRTCILPFLFFSVFCNLKLNHTHMHTHAHAQLKARASTRFRRLPHTISIFTYARGVNLKHFANAMSNAEEFSWILLICFTLTFYSIMFLPMLWHVFVYTCSSRAFCCDLIFIVVEFLCSENVKCICAHLLSICKSQKRHFVHREEVKSRKAIVDFIEIKNSTTRTHTHTAFVYFVVGGTHRIA